MTSGPMIRNVAILARNG